MYALDPRDATLKSTLGLYALNPNKGKIVGKSVTSTYSTDKTVSEPIGQYLRSYLIEFLQESSKDLGVSTMLK